MNKKSIGFVAIVAAASALYAAVRHGKVNRDQPQDLEYTKSFQYLEKVGLEKTEIHVPKSDCVGATRVYIGILNGKRVIGEIRVSDTGEVITSPAYCSAP